VIDMTFDLHVVKTGSDAGFIKTAARPRGCNAPIGMRKRIRRLIALG
jgi:hypothetical protein